MSLTASIYDKALQLARGQIRLLYVTPSNDFDAPLDCSLQVATLANEAQGYNTLSYCGGERKSSTPITLNGEPWRITKELALALRRVRALTDSYSLWVDQLCISQEDNDERSDQLRLMTQIFSGCHICYCYLGEDDQDSHEAFTYARWAYQDIEGRPLQATTGTYPDTFLLQPQPPSGERQDDPRYSESGAVAFIKLAQRQYFERRWIIQETAVSNHVLGLCGPYLFLMQYLIHAFGIHSMHSEEEQKQKSIRTALPYRVGSDAMTIHHLVRHARRNYHKDSNKGDGESGLRLMDLILQTAGTKVTDKRDAFYALLGLAVDQADFPPPDYSWTIEQTFLRYTEVFVKQGYPLLCLRKAHRNTCPGLPSWVPDCSSITRSDELNLSPTPGSVFSTSVLLSINGLEVQYLRLDSIADARRPNALGITSAKILQTRVYATLSMLFARLQPSTTPDEILSRLNRAPGRIKSWDTFDDNNNEASRAANKLLTVIADDSNVELIDKQLNEKALALWELKGLFEEWQVAWMTGLEICMAPFEAEKGDIVVLLESMKDAAVLVRRVKADRHRYMGMCWIEGQAEISDFGGENGERWASKGEPRVMQRCYERIILGLIVG